jgi:hypothetical protein
VPFRLLHNRPRSSRPWPAHEGGRTGPHLDALAKCRPVLANDGHGVAVPRDPRDVGRARVTGSHRARPLPRARRSESATIMGRWRWAAHSRGPQTGHRWPDFGPRRRRSRFAVSDEVVTEPTKKQASRGADVRRVSAGSESEPPTAGSGFVTASTPLTAPDSQAPGSRARAD